MWIKQTKNKLKTNWKPIKSIYLHLFLSSQASFDSGHQHFKTKLISDESEICLQYKLVLRLNAPQK